MAKRRARKDRIDPIERRIRQYRERNRIVRSMGYATYAAYLKSDLWAEIRGRILTKSNVCFLCDGVANQVHHLRYTKKVMEGREDRRLVPICGRCHKRIEFRDDDNEKLNVTQATAKLRQLRTTRTKTPLPPMAIESDCDEVAIDHAAIRIADGVYLTPEVLAVGDTVRLTNGTVDQITTVRQSNYLPRFRVGGRWVGKNKIRTKFVTRTST
jgi:hypothetical protein